MGNTKQAGPPSTKPADIKACVRCFSLYYLFISFAEDLDIFSEQLVFMDRDILAICIRMQLDEA